ncbi:phospholipase, partial [Pseudomonas paraeruginosa]
SANVNARSMEGDSELNIACPSPSLTKQWREHLWGIHAKGVPEVEIGKEFMRWSKLMTHNENSKTKPNGSGLTGSLVSFHDSVKKSMAALD